MANKWLSDLKKLDFAVDMNYDSYSKENCFYTPSPYMNWISSNSANGYPKNASILLFSAPKSGKSILCLSMIAEMHRTDPEGIAVYVSTELRGQLQATNFPGIDPDRILIIDSNDASEIMDTVVTELKAKVQDGMPLKMFVLDSVNGIVGTKRKNADSVEQHLIGDGALTIGNVMDGLVPWCKRNKILLVGTAQLRANLEAGSHGPRERLGASWKVKHSFEFFISVKRAGSADDKTDISGKTFEDEEIKDARGNKILTAHKIYVKMEESSIGTAGRSGVMTIEPGIGLINQHEEIFWLGKNTGVITTPNNRTYIYQGQSFNGKKECAYAIRDNPKMAQDILADVRALDAKK